MRLLRRIVTVYAVIFGIDDALERARTRLHHR